MKPAPSEIRTAADLRAALADMDYEEALRELDELSSGLREEMRPWKEIIRIELLQLLGSHAEALISGLELLEDVSLDEGIRRTAGRRMFYGYLFGLKEPAAAARMITLLHDLECDEAKDGQLAWLLELYGGELHVEETLSPVSIASEFTLSSYPNPFNPANVIEFSLPVDGMVNLNVYDILGRKVTTLVDDFREAGMYRVEFNAGYLPSGMYFTRLEAGGQSLIHRMLLVK